MHFIYLCFPGCNQLLMLVLRSEREREGERKMEKESEREMDREREGEREMDREKEG